MHGRLASAMQPVLCKYSPTIDARTQSWLPIVQSRLHLNLALLYVAVNYLLAKQMMCRRQNVPAYPVMHCGSQCDRILCMVKGQAARLERDTTVVWR